MNPLYEKAKDVVLIRRTSDNKEFEEYPLILQPQSALVTDPANDIQCFGLCGLHVGFATSASYADTSSFAWYALSASFANSASYCLSSSNAISASYTYTASYALETSAALDAIYAISASYAFSASYAQSASYGANFYAPRVTASVVSASNGIFMYLTASNMLVTGLAVETASYATNAGTAGYAASATNASTATLAVNALTASNVQSSSHALVSDSTLGTVANANFASLAGSASFASSSISSSHSLFADATSGTASYANFANVSSMSLSTLGLNVQNAPPQPNPQMYWTTRWPGSINAAYITQSQIPVSTRPHATTKVNNKLYAGSWDGWLYVIPDPDNSLSGVISASFIAGNYISQVAYSSVTGFLYFLCGNTISHSAGLPYGTGSIVKVDPNNINSQTMLVQGLAGTSGFDIFNNAIGTLVGLATDGNYLYTVQNSTIYKFDAVTGITIGTSGSALGGTHAGGVVVDGYAYFAGGGTVMKFNTITLSASYSPPLTFFDGYGTFGGSVTDDLAYLNGYIYVEQDDGAGAFGLWKVRTSDMTWTPYTGNPAWGLQFNNTSGSSLAYPTYYGGFGVFSDTKNIYVLQRQEIWVYLGGDLDSGPIRFNVPGRPNELWITDGGKYVYTDWDGGGMVYEYYLPITELGINKLPNYALDVAGVINSDIQVQTPSVSASVQVLTNYLSFAGADLYGDVNLNDGSSLTSGNYPYVFSITTASVQVPTISASIALLGRPFNTRFSQSFGPGSPMKYTQSMGTIAQDGMYRLAVAGTIGFYSSSTVIAPPSWSFKHTDRLGAYRMPNAQPLYSVVNPPSYDVGYSFYGDYIFQAIKGSAIEYYYDSYGADVSSTACSASFFTTVTLAQMLSGSVTGSI